jgi:HPt (histidine-containing phosphotransfer) domain-containing protein
MINREKFDETFHYFDKDVIVNIIDLFEKGLSERLEKIQKNINEQDFEDLVINIHSLKSVTGPFMAVEPYELICKIEELANQGSIQDLQELYEKLKTSMDELVSELTEIRKEQCISD